MDDAAIVDLYWARNECAIEQTQRKYGGYCRYIAHNVLHDARDEEECLNDAYAAVWSCIPPQRPARLKAFLGAIVRNTALKQYRRNHARKRSAETQAVVSEFYDCIPDRGQNVEQSVMIRDVIERFLSTLDQLQRTVFLQRYWYLCPISDIAKATGRTQSNVKVILHRLREKFRSYIEQEDFSNE